MCCYGAQLFSQSGLPRRIVYASEHMEAEILTGNGIKIFSKIHLIKHKCMHSLPCGHHMCDLNGMPCPIRTKEV